MANITREEAQRRSEIITAGSYEVVVDLTGQNLPAGNDKENFISETRIQFGSAGGESWIDLIADQALEITLDGEPLDTALFENNRVYFTTELGEHTLEIKALCRYSHTGEGLHRFVDPADDRVYLYTQFETADARRVFPNFEQPDQKATFQFTVLAPADWAVLSNSVTPEPADLGDGFARWEFATTPRISTYITALIAGEYHVEPGTSRSVKGDIPAGLVCRQSMKDYLDSDRIRTTTQRGFDVFEASFATPYAFDTYDQIFVPEFNAGAMENAGCVTFRDEYLPRSRVTAAVYEQRNNTIWHELAHMWFGDLVTMKWWDDLWLNESFAEWAAHFCGLRNAELHGGIDPWVGFANHRKGWAYTQDQMETTHPVAADMIDLETVEQNFDGITYAKGASVLKQLVSLVGEEDFMKGVGAYFAEHAWGNTVFDDLLSALTTASGKDLSGFSADWLETAGVNPLRPVIEESDGVITRFAIAQEAPAEHPYLRTHHLAIGFYDLTDGKLVAREIVEVDVSGELTELPQFIGKTRPDVVLLNDRDLAYAKIRLDDASLAAAVAHIDGLEDPLATAIVYTSAWDMWRDGELAPVDFISLVLRSVTNEPDLMAVQARLRNALNAATNYTAPANRLARMEQLADGARALLVGAEPGSDHQLAFSDSYLDSLTSAEDVAIVKGWLQGEGVPEGLAIDADRRWRIVTALARLGEITAEEIDAEAANDLTITGAQFAAGARSALATEEAKAKAWQSATEDGSIPNGTYFELCTKFWQPRQEELLSGYAEKYLEMARAISGKTGIWENRGHATIQTALTGLWPLPVISWEFVAQAEALIDYGEMSSQVARVMKMNLDISRRALNSQQL